MGGGQDCGRRLRHSAAFAKEIMVRCVMCKEPAYRVARDLRLDERQVIGMVKVLRRRMYSPERLALIVMRDPGFDDSDIAEIFGRSERWAKLVREQADQIRQEEYVPESLEYLDEGLQPGDPMPSEIAERTQELHRTGQFKGRKECAIPASLTQVSWRGDAFVSVCVE